MKMSDIMFIQPRETWSVSTVKELLLLMDIEEPSSDLKWIDFLDEFLDMEKHDIVEVNSFQRSGGWAQIMPPVFTLTATNSSTVFFRQTRLFFRRTALLQLQRTGQRL